MDSTPQSASFLSPAESARGERVGRTGDAVLVAELERVDDADDLVELTTGRGGVGEGEADDTLGVLSKVGRGRRSREDEDRERDQL